MHRISVLIAAIGFAMLAGSAQAVPPRLPHGALLHDLSEDQIDREFYSDNQTLIREGTFRIHYGGILTGAALCSSYPKEAGWPVVSVRLTV